MPAQQRMDGVDLTPLLLQQRPLTERAVCWRIGRSGAVRRGPWKVKVDDRKQPQLYNLTHDLGETTDVARQHPELEASLTAAYAAWEVDVGGGFTRIGRK